MLIQWIKDRSKEASTASGAIIIAALIGITITPEQVDAIFGVVIAVIALWETLRKEK